jgi:hypothetical protein
MGVEKRRWGEKTNNPTRLYTSKSIGQPKEGTIKPSRIKVSKGINEPSAPIDLIKLGEIPIDHGKSLSLFYYYHET